jgi:hypothetical protein
LFLKPVLKPGGKYSFGNNLSKLQKRIFPMKDKIALLALYARKINRQHIQLALVIFALAMLVLGAGAPDDGGGF